MAKDLGKINIEITESKQPLSGVTGGAVSGENRDLSRAIGDSLSKSTIKIAGLAGLDGVAKTIISALSKFSRVVERVTKTTGLLQAKTTDRALETSQKVTERIVKKPTDAHSPIGFRQPRPAPVRSIAKQLAPMYRKQTMVSGEGVSPTSDFLNKLSQRRTSLPQPTSVAQSVIKKVQPSPIAQRLAQRVQPILPQPTHRPAVRRVLSLAEQAGQTYQRTPDSPKGFIPRPAPQRGSVRLGGHPAFSAHQRGESGRANLGGVGASAANKAAKTAMGGVGKTMATAARGIMTALGAALLNPVTIIIGIILVGVAVAAIAIAKFVAQIWKWSEDLMKTRDRLAAFSGALAASKASSNINQLFRDIRSARRLEQPLTAISSQRGRIKKLWHPIADLLTVIKSIVVSTFLPIIEMLVKGLTQAAFIVAAFVIAMTKVVRALSVVFRFLHTILSKLSWVLPSAGKYALAANVIATGLEGMLEGIENSNAALNDIFAELLKGNRQNAAATLNADMASTASRLTGKRTPEDKDYRWSPKFGGGGNP